jgi:alginate O-acetyltransferase complex protein AlgI
MIFNTWAYAVFLPVVAALYWLAPGRWRGLLLTAAGAFFYWYYFPPHLPVIVGLTLAVFAAARVVGSWRGWEGRLVFVVAVGASVAVLVYCKYTGLVAGTAAALLGLEPPQGTAVRAPLGISFFIFEYVHYLVEVRRGTFTPAPLGDFVLFILFFPTLICGPIKRFQQFAPQEHEERRLNAADVNEGLERILFGLAKKTLVADALAPYCAGVFASPGGHTWGQLWLAVYGYAMQIYFDFSGYSDIAIGSARLFGYRVPENFNYPYLQPNIARFWRAWHMSLTSWITDYVYIPLGGNRRGEARAHANRLLSMTLCGLWHGAAWHFALWGLYHGVALSAYRLWQQLRTRLLGAPAAPAHWAVRGLGVLLTFHVVCIGWVLFVCDLDDATHIIPRLLLLGGGR